MPSVAEVRPTPSATPAVATRVPVAIYYEHPRWFDRLFAELDRRGRPTRRFISTIIDMTLRRGASRPTSCSTA